VNYRIKQTRPHKRFKILPYLIFALIILGGFGYLSLFSATEPGQEDVRIVVKNGESLADIGTELHAKKIIRSPLAFRIVARVKGIDREIRSGVHTLTQGKSLSDVLQALTQSSPEEISITIPEGYSVYDIDALLAGRELITAGKFIEKAAQYEGRLFPDTYFIFTENFTPDQLIRKMRVNFESKMTEDVRRKIAASGRSEHDILVMASILEKEVRTPKDLALVSGILWKRLDNSWALQADATLLYGKKDKTITSADLESNTPYNTRKFRGMPPTPIANPGLATIMAAIEPESSPYWFYLTDAEGTVYYAVTNEEHNENRRKHL